MADFNILANTQYSRIQHNRTDVSGSTPTIFINTGSTSGYTESDALALNQLSATDILDTELFFNTADKKIYARLDDTIVEFVTSGGTLSDTYTTGATLNGNILSFNRNDLLSAYTVNLSGISSVAYWTAGTGTDAIVQRNSNGSASGTLAVAEGQLTTASGYGSHAEGIQSTAVGSGSHAEGYLNTSNSTYTHTGGQRNIASGTNAFVHSSGSTVYGDDSTILGGSGNVILNNVTGSTILGGSFITGDTSDTVYGVNFNASNTISAPTLSATTYLNLPTVSTLTFMFVSGASSIATYKQAIPLSNYIASGVSISSTTVTTTPTILGAFATNVGQPNLTVIPSGEITIHYDVQKQSGGQQFYTYVEIYKRTSGGTETLLTTSDNSSQTALNTIQNITVSASLASNTLLNLTDRIVTKIYAVMVSSTATIDLRIDDATNARVQLPYAQGTTFDIYTTGATLNSGTLSFNRNDNVSYSVNLTSLSSPFTAGTGTNSAVLGGSNSVASGILSYAEGTGTTASDIASHAEGSGTTASGAYAHAEGLGAKATGIQGAHAEGWLTSAGGDYGCHAEGHRTTANGNRCHAEGGFTTASGDANHAQGFNTKAIGGGYGHAEGYSTTSSGGEASHAEGRDTLASASYSHAGGLQSIASGYASRAIGFATQASGTYSFTKGNQTYATGVGAAAQGKYTRANGDYSHVGGIGYNNNTNRVSAQGLAAFNHSIVDFYHPLYDEGATGDGSVILGGLNHYIKTGATYSSIIGGSTNKILDNVTGSTVLGGSNITGTTSDTVYGVNFNASGTITSGGTNLLSLLSDTGSNSGSGTGIFSGKTGTTLFFKSLTSTGNTVTINSTGSTINLESNPVENKSFILSSPIAGDRIPIFTVDRAATITKLIYQANSGSTTFNVVTGGNFLTNTTSLIGGTGATASATAVTITAFGGTNAMASGDTLTYVATGSTFTSGLIYLSIFYKHN